MSREEEFNNVYMKMTENVASLSRAKRKKVGCILVDQQDNIISYGFNGTPTGFDNSCEYINEYGEFVTKDEVLHAESNAITKIAKSTNSSDGCKMYITLSPCIHCAKLIIQSGIKEVYYKEEYRNNEGLLFLEKSKIKITKLL